MASVVDSTSTYGPAGSVSSCSESTIAAPCSNTVGMNLCPSTLSPFIGIKRYPSFTCLLSMTAPVIVVSSSVSSPMYVPSQAFAIFANVRFFMYLSDMLHLIFFQRYVNQMLTELIKTHTDNRGLLWQKTGRSHARQCVCLEAEHLIFVIEQKV